MPLFAQFKNLDDPNILLNAILNLGFDDVFEVALGAEILANRSRDFIATHQENWPYLSTNCPAIVRLVRMSRIHASPVWSSD